MHRVSGRIRAKTGCLGVGDDMLYHIAGFWHKQRECGKLHVMDCDMTKVGFLRERISNRMLKAQQLVGTYPRSSKCLNPGY